MYPSKPMLNISEQIDNENISNISLTIYYLSPYALMFYPESSVEGLTQHSEKIVINGSDLEQKIDLFKQINNSQWCIDYKVR